MSDTWVSLWRAILILVRAHGDRLVKFLFSPSAWPGRRI
ncbi:hypothetical protein SAMN05444161_5183 [Rhizobiales bacterium GAS191]|jgi:hypothetical protein|nr:hypothetical protein SAMN05519103_04448 [Rhizobiales bacterium GAS113]SEE22839.1 hypothetical protein SAMN05444161_5183 [Rhizobiales bacterium GAS191]